MKVIEDYLKKELRIRGRSSWQEIRWGYMERANRLIRDDWQAPAYLTSIENQAGRRAGKIIGNINDYTRDMHDLASQYQDKFVREYLPRTTILPMQAYVTSSGMAALTTIVVMLHRSYGVGQTVLVGKHSYFQNQELLHASFARVISFDESRSDEWERRIEQYQPRAVLVDSLCNEPDLTRPMVSQIAAYIAKKSKDKTYLVVDNSMLSLMFDWKEVLKYKSRTLEIVGWESLNKYYQFGLDRVTGGIVWGSCFFGSKNSPS